MRKEPRFPSRAKVILIEFAENDSAVVLKDLSRGGGRIQCVELLDLMPNTRYAIEIIPEFPKVKQFSLDVESRWIRANRLYCESGFAIVGPLPKKVFNRYLGLLKKGCPSAIRQTHGSETACRTTEAGAADVLR